MPHPERPEPPAPSELTPEDQRDLVDFARAVESGWIEACKQRAARAEQRTRPNPPPSAEPKQAAVKPRDKIAEYGRRRDPLELPGGLADRYVLHAPIGRTIRFAD